MPERIWTIYVMIVSLGFFISLSTQTIANSHRTYRLLLNQVALHDLSSGDRLRIAKQIHQALKWGDSIQVTLDNKQKAFTEKEIIHMKDVSQLIRYNQLGMFIFALLTLLGIKRYSFLSFPKLRNIGILSIICLLSATIVMGVFFPQLFWLFHRISFSNDYWLLDPQQHLLIRIFPLVFFQWAVLWIMIASIVFSLLFWIIIPYIFTRKRT